MPASLRRVPATLVVAIVLAVAPLMLAQGTGTPAGTSTPGAATPRQGGRQGGPPQGTPPPRQGRFPRAGASGQPTGTARIRGRVVAADSGTPLRRAQVRAQNGPLSRQTFTDENGRYELTGLSTGEWTVTAVKAGYVALRAGQRRPAEVVPLVRVTEGEAAPPADFALPRGSVLAGRVTDEFGDPVSGARVQALSYRVVRGQRQVMLVGMVSQTDDTGSYRLYGLGPGEYYVSARADIAVDSADGAAAYAPTYFPGTGSLADAQRVPLATGEEQTGVSFPLLLVRTVRVAGVAVDSGGAPLAGGLVSLSAPFSPDDLSQLLSSSTRIREDGSFTFSNVVPGSYTLQAVTGGAFRGSPRRTPEVAYVPVTIGNEDATGVAVSTVRGATLGGALAAEQGQGRLPAAASMTVQAQALRPMPGFGQRAIQVSADGTFLLEGLIGPQLVRVTGVPREWMVARVEINGADLTDTPIDFKGTERVSATIVLTNRVPEITGTVRSDRAPAGGSQVVVFPADDTKWGYASRYVQAARTEPDGTFSIRALPPGDRYLAAALEYLDEGDAENPEFLERLRAEATPFSLRAGERTELTLSLAARPR